MAIIESDLAELYVINRGVLVWETVFFDDSGTGLEVKKAGKDFGED